METLRARDKGPDVELAQAALNYHIGKGKKITVDGRFGSETQNRVIAFQRFHGLVQDGIIGDKTRAKLFQAITFMVSAAIMKRPAGSGIRQAVAPSLAFAGASGGSSPKLLDFSDLKMWPDVRLWPEPPVLANPWPKLILTLPPFPQMPGLPPPPAPPRLMVNTSVVPGSTIYMPPPMFDPAFKAPSADIFMMKFSVLSREKNLKVSGELEPMRDDDGHTYKFQATAKAEVDVISGGHIDVDAYTRIELEGSPGSTDGKVTGSSGLRYKFLNGRFELATDVTWMIIDTEKNLINIGLSAFKGVITAFF